MPRLRCVAAADPNAVDAARVLRLPLTLHSKSGKQAEYRFLGGGVAGAPPTYTLNEMAEFCGLAAPVAEGEDRPTLRARKTGTQPGRSNGSCARDTYRADDLLRIEKSRGGWPKGCRWNRLRLYASFLRGQCRKQADIEAALQQMAGRCRPPYPSDPNDTKVALMAESVFREALKVPNTYTLCQWLEVTPDLARALKLVSILPAAVREEKLPIQGGQRGVLRQARRDAVSTLVGRHGLLSCRAIAKALGEQGITASPWIVNQDLHQLGYRGLAKAAEESSTVPDSGPKEVLDSKEVLVRKENGEHGENHE